MPKRNSTETILENLSAKDIDAAERKADQLKTIPDPVWEAAIRFELVFSSKDFNVRDAESYAFSANKALFRSLQEKGLEKRGDPMAFHVEPDGRYKVMVGNLRFTMMSEIRRIEIERRATDGLDADPDTLPFATIFGLVYRDLTIGQQTAIMADHLGRKTLNEFEKCKEIGEFIEQNGLTDAQSVVHFGMEKNKVRRYRMRWAMPTVMAEFRKEKSGGTEPYVTVGQKALDFLYSAYRTDIDAGNDHRHEGPAFRKAWAEYKANPDMFSDSSKPKPGSGPASLDRKALVNQVSATLGGYGDTPEMIAIADALRFASGDGVNLNTVRDTIKDYCDSLRSEVETLRTEVESLRSENATLSERIANMQADLDGTLAECQELRAKVKPARKNGGK